jgi:hypothetical protein
MTGSSFVTYTAHIRLLACEFEILTNSRDVMALLAFLTQRADQDMPIVERGAVTVTWTGDEFRFEGDGIEADFELGLPSAVDALYRHMYGRAIAALPDHIRVGAACGTQRGWSFLIAGPQGVGKTVLALHLLLDGFDITGDALTLLRGGEAVPFPRKFELRQDCLPQLPKLASMERFASIARNPQGERVVALDPHAFGKPWRISPAPVAAIFCLEPNFGAARTTLLPCAKVDTVRRLIAQCTPPVSGRRDWLADLCATVDRADTYVITLGDLASASTAIGSALARLR